METLLDQTVARLSRLPFFSPTDYASLNSDVAQSGMDLARHALLYGCAEKRQLFIRDRLARAWGEARVRKSTAQPAVGAAKLPAAATVLVSSWSAPAIRDIADCLVRDLAFQGVATTLETERSMPEVVSDRTIVVAPHEFFRLGLGSAWRRTALARSALMLNTASLASDDFTSALPYLLASRGVLDLSPQMVDIFIQADVPALQIRPSIASRYTWLKAEDEEHPLVHALPVEARKARIAAKDPRPIDVSFAGARTAWRSECLARIAPELTGLRTVFRLESSVAELIERKVLERAWFRITGHIAARSKLALQLAGPDVPSLDWLATFQSMAAGAVVVTDCATLHREFRSGVHLFQEDSRHLPDLIRWLLSDTEGRAAAETARSANQSTLSDPASGTTWIAQAARLWASA